VVAAVVGLAVMIGGPTSTVLHPLSTITGAVTGGGSNEVSATDQTSTTSVDPDDPDSPNPPDRPAKGGAKTATTRSASSATTVAPSSSTPTSAAPVAGTTPPPTSPVGACKAGDLTWTTATNKNSYRAGDTVTISMHARNSSDRPCYAPRPCGAAMSATVTDYEGNPVWQSGSTTTPCDFGTTTPLLNPHDSYSYGTAGSWDQMANGSRAPAKSYRVTARRGTTTANGATFALQ
jgi:hypothetical protein